MVGLGVDAHDTPNYVPRNVLGTSRLLSAMARAGVLRLVQASSMDPRRVSENVPEP